VKIEKLYCTTRKLLSSQIVKRKKCLEEIKVLVKIEEENEWFLKK
jgi:hypothetical protein